MLDGLCHAITGRYAGIHQWISAIGKSSDTLEAGQKIALGAFPMRAQAKDAGLLYRPSMLLAHPEVREALTRLSGRITVADMRRMNNAVDAQHRDPGEVAREFLSNVLKF